MTIELSKEYIEHGRLLEDEARLIRKTKLKVQRNEFFFMCILHILRNLYLIPISYVVFHFLNKYW